MRSLALALLISSTAFAESAEIRAPSQVGIPSSLWEGTSTAPAEGGFMGFPLDKIAHGAVSGALTPLAIGVLTNAGVPIRWAIVNGALVVFGLGVLKEVIDIATTPAAMMQARLYDSIGDLAFDLGGCAGGAFAVTFILQGIHVSLRLSRRSLLVSGVF